MRKRNFLTSPRLLELRKRRRNVFLRKICFLMIALLVFFFLLVFISRSPSFNISGVKIIGNIISDSEIIKALVEKEIKGNYLWFFPKTNVLFYPKNSIEKELHDKFKGLNDISFFIRSGNTLELSLSQRTALYTWCGLVPPDTSSQSEGQDQKCYYLDSEGYIFDEAAYFSGDVYFKFYGQTNLENGVPSGSYFAGQNFSKLIHFVDVLKNMKLEPVALYTEKNDDIKIFLQGRAQALGPQIVFKIDSDFNKVAENLEAALTTEPLLSNFKNKYSSLLYIDLRYGNKVYYKFQ